MLGELPRIHGAVQGIGFLVGQNRPFVSFMVRNWPLAVIAGLAMYGKVRERHKKGELNTFNALGDLGLVLSPLVGIALLNQMAKAEHAPAATTVPVSATVRPG